MVKCPSCGASLPATGEVEVAGEPYGVYQCDNCIVPWDFDGAKFDSALTFALDTDGRIVNADSFESLDLSGIRRGSDPESK
jgi:hypothetical protein